MSVSFFGKSPFWETSISQICTDIMPAHLELDANELGWLLEQCCPYADLSEFHASLFHRMEALQVCCQWEHVDG